MHTQKRKLSAAGWALPPIVIPNGGAGFPALVSVELETGASLTYSVFQFSDRMRPGQGLACNITRATTTATVVLKTGAQPKVDDLVYIEGAGGTMDGWFPIASVASTTQFTYTVTNSGPTQSLPNTRAWIFRPLAIVAGLTGQTGDAAASLPGPASAVAIKATSYTSGGAMLSVTHAK